MSYITTENTEYLTTMASLNTLQRVLIENGFRVTKTQSGLSAIKKSVWSSRHYFITITDSKKHRGCYCKEIACGLLVTPKGNMLAEIINNAEMLDSTL